MGIFDVMDRGVANAATKRLGMSALGMTLSSDVSLVLPADPTDGLERAWHAGWRRWGLGLMTGPAAAGQIIRFQFRNPDPPNRMVVVLESIKFQTGISATSDRWQIGILGIGPGIADNSTIVTGASPLDGRNAAPLGTASRGQLIVSWQSQAPTIPVANSFIHEFVAPVTNTGTGDGGLVATMNNLPIVLLPGNALFGENNALAVQLLVNLRWRERMLNDQEGAI